MAASRSENEETVNTRLLYWSKTQPDQPAFTFIRPTTLDVSVVLTRADVFTLASRYAAILRRQGIRQGDVVCNTLVNCPERLLTDLGIMLAGAVALNGATVLSDGADFVGNIRKSHCVAAILDPNSERIPHRLMKPLLRSADHRADCPDDRVLTALLYVDCGFGQNGHKPFLEQLRKEEETYVAEVKPGDLAYIFNTSGGAGFSKLAPRSHAEYIRTGNAMCELIGSQPDDVIYNAEDFGWITGAPCDYVARGVTRSAYDETELTEPMDVEHTLKVIRTAQCSVALMFLVWTESLLTEARSFDHFQPKLRALLTGGQPVTKRQLEVIGKLTESVVIGYGSTECGPLTRKVVTADNKDDYEDGNNGLPLTGVKLKLVDEHDQEVVEPGRTGEVLCRGPAVFSGYMGMDQAAQDNVFTRDGWFRTTDIGYFNSQGELHVVCRKSNGIIYGPIIVYPGWLESRILGCPGVQSVFIVPVPDPDKYQELCTCVMRKPGAKMTEQDVLDFCKTVFLYHDSPDACVPRYCVFLDSVPTQTTGKPDRKAILTSAVQKLGMADTPSTFISSLQ